jgi:hypothetical protein
MHLTAPAPAPAAALTERAGRPVYLHGTGPIDPDPGANTSDRYQTGASAHPGIQRVSVPNRCPAGPVTGMRHVH